MAVLWVPVPNRVPMSKPSTVSASRPEPEPSTDTSLPRIAEPLSGLPLQTYLVPLAAVYLTPPAVQLTPGASVAPMTDWPSAPAGPGVPVLAPSRPAGPAGPTAPSTP